MLPRMTTSAAAPALSLPEKAPRVLLYAALGALAFSLLMLGALHVSENPVPGDFPYALMAWAQHVATVAGAVLLAVAFTLRQLSPSPHDGKAAAGRQWG